MPLATDMWLTVPFSSTTKSSFEKLIDLMLTIPSLLSRVQEFFTLDFFRPPKDRINDFTNDLERLDQKLQAWWFNYETEMMGSDGEGWLYHDLGLIVMANTTPNSVTSGRTAHSSVSSIMSSVSF